ncbi:ABC transporter ATP-binding protein [Microvirga antarctica]|uniref:ABC transporter ATP-binding protein n=1 Tax=Microvirga antarctica TaxID=2819233 RepID=UPI001B312066|nr:sn-glycerol-3-phosphate ABC transporter ATP-binding protein UgpC [Microvirga antarctica]
MAGVDLRSIRKAFGDTDILSGVSFGIAHGEFVALVGPSGCGKSTLLRIIAGLEGISSGEVLIDGKLVNTAPPKERDIAMVFQNYALYPHMTVAENMGFSLKLSRKSKAEIAASVGTAAEILGLASLLDRYPRQLSGGQRQRVAMGRAIVRNPKVFLFDEPLSNLDAKLRVQMRAEIKELHQRLGTTTIYVTHDQIEALTMADKIVVMNGGVVEQMGAPLDLYDYPQTRFVAGFIGSPSMNFIEGVIETQGSFRSDAGITLPLPPVSPENVGRAAVYGFRPEHVDRNGDSLVVQITVSEPTGSETLVVARLGPHPVTLLFRERIPATPGGSLGIRIDASKVHLFDAASGKRIPVPGDFTAHVLEALS